MDPIFIIAIVICGLMVVLLIICFCVMTKLHKREESRRNELDAVYSDPKLAKMEYDIAFYDDESPARTASARNEDDEQVTIEDVMVTAVKSARAGEDNAIFDKIDDGMEEISGHYNPKE